jgi:hypothetical protein
MNEELLRRWKDIVKAVFWAEYAVLERGEELNKDAEDKKEEADRWVTLVAQELLTKQND